MFGDTKKKTFSTRGIGISYIWYLGTNFSWSIKKYNKLVYSRPGP